MKRKDYLKEVRGMSKEDKLSRVREISEETLKLRFRSAAGQLDQTHQIRQTKKRLARTFTVMNQELAKKA